MNQPLVSAIITTHNRIGLLPRAIESVLNQTYDNIELLVVDDASTDGTAEYCRAHGIKCLSIPKNESRGGNYARNLGIRNTTGMYVALLDDDDYWLPEKTKKQVELLEASGDDVAHCAFRKEIIQPDGSVKFEDRHYNPGKFEGDLSKFVLYNIIALTSSLLISRNILNSVGLFDENVNFWQEYELTIRLAQKSHFALCHSPLMVYRMDANDATRLTNKYFGWKKSVKYIYRKHRALYSNLNAVERNQARLMRHREAVARAICAGLVLRRKYHSAMLRLLTRLQCIR